MEYHILALGDVTSETGVRHLARRLRELKRLCGIDFTVVNGENISGVGLTPEQAEDLFAAGADVITLGNHTWGACRSPTTSTTAPISCAPRTSQTASPAAAGACTTAAACRSA